MLSAFLKGNDIMIEILHIKKSYGKKTVLQDISFSAEQGQCIGILGGNGSGKSTLLNVLSGVISPDDGAFLYNGTDISKDSKKRSALLGYVPQGTPLLEELTALDNLRLRYEKTDLHNLMENGVLKMLGIDSFLKTPVHKMSGGMKKRLSIGCSVANNPRILLLDEPSAALDLVCKAKISDYLNDFRANGGIVVLATHDLQEIPLCDKLYILKNGCLYDYDFDGDIHRLAENLEL